jgi:hypothetical protein
MTYEEYLSHWKWLRDNIYDISQTLPGKDRHGKFKVLEPLRMDSIEYKMTRIPCPWCRRRHWAKEGIQRCARRKT